MLKCDTRPHLTGVGKRYERDGKACVGAAESSPPLYRYAEEEQPPSLLPGTIKLLTSCAERRNILLDRLMNPEEIKAWSLAGSAAIAALKEAIKLLPSGAKKEEAERAITRAEHEMKEAEASAAKKLGFEICSRCWPPEIMTIGDDDLYRCRACNKPFPGSGSETLKIRTHGTEQNR